MLPPDDGRGAGAGADRRLGISAGGGALAAFSAGAASACRPSVRFFSFS